ncbi:MAG: hypothetical protein V7765_21120 [Oleispira sp.]
MSEYKEMERSFTVKANGFNVEFNNIDTCQVVNGVLIIKSHGYHVAAFSIGKWDSFWETTQLDPLVIIDKT